MKFSGYENIPLKTLNCDVISIGYQIKISRFSNFKEQTDNFDSISTMMSEKEPSKITSASSITKDFSLQTLINPGTK